MRSSIVLAIAFISSLCGQSSIPVSLTQLLAGSAVTGQRAYFDGFIWRPLQVPVVVFATAMSATLSHNLGHTPTRWRCYLTSDNKDFEPKDVTFTSNTQMTFTFDTPTSGRCTAR